MKEEIKDKSYATISLHRIEHSKAMQLFGSNAPITTSVVLKISPAIMYRDVIMDHVSAHGRPLIEVEMTPNQFSELITHFNCGSGTPCTIRQKDGELYEQKNFESRISSIKELFAKRIQDRLSLFTEDAAKMATWCKNGRPTKEQLQTMKNIFDGMINEYRVNIPYFMECFEESFAELSTEVKSEFENWMVKRISDAGIQALNEKFEQKQLENDTKTME